MSASLPGSMNSWMFTLKERFDLETGKCRDGSIPVERQPKVRVVGEDALIGPTSPGARSASKTSSEHLLALRAREEARNITPIHLRWTNRDLIPLSALEEFMRTSKPLLAAKLAPQFVTEDGSDRNDWASGGRQPSEQTIRDFTVQSGGLRPPLAGVCYRDLEFLLEVDEKLPVLAGTIDYLWQDATGDWHLLAFTSEDFGASFRLGRSSGTSENGRKRSIASKSQGAGKMRSLTVAALWTRCESLSATSLRNRWRSDGRRGKRLLSPFLL